MKHRGLSGFCLLAVLVMLLLVLVIVSASSAPSLAADSPQTPAEVEGIDSWTWHGPSWNIAAGCAPQVWAIAMDPATPSVVYAGTVHGFYRSTDTGNTWQARNLGLEAYGGVNVVDMEIDPSNHQRLVIGTWGDGLFQSIDSGLHWTRLTDPLASLELQAFAAPNPVGPSPDARQVRAGASSLTAPLGAADPPKQPLPVGVMTPPHQLAAGDQVESLLGLPGRLPWTPVRDVAMHPSNSSQIFACVDNGYGVFVSNNSGGSWSPVSNLPNESCRTYTFAPSNSLVRYASFGSWTTTAGLCRTTTGGTSWTEVGSPEIQGTVIAVAIHPTNSNIVLAATSDYGLFRSSNGGDTWTCVSDSSSLPDADFYSVAFSPSNPNIAYAGGLLWVYRSGDAGATWTNADASFPAYYVQGLAIHPSSSSTVLVGPAYFPYGGIYRRTSDTVSFALTASGMSDTFVLDIEQDPNDPNMLYAATWGAGVFRSDDGGTHWQHLFGVSFIHTLEATQGPTGTILYAGAGTTSGLGYILKSWDNGSSWVAVNAFYWGFSDNRDTLDIVSLDGGPDNLVAATINGPELSYDGGQTWSQASGLNQGLVLKLAQSPFDQNRLLAATYGGGIWSSTDGGASWSEASVGLDSQYVYDVAFAPWDPNTAYAASLGVYRTVNGGASWSLSGLSGTYAQALDILGAPGYEVFAGTQSEGVYMAPERTDSWFELNTGLEEKRIRALNALDYDTLFAGTYGRGAWEYTIVNRPRPEEPNIGFRPYSDGYSFSNSDGFPSPRDYFSHADMVQMLGQNCVCYMDGGICRLKPHVAEWYQNVVSKLTDGRCLGMSAGSLRFFTGLDTHEDTPTTYDLSMDDRVEHTLPNDSIWLTTALGHVYYHQALQFTQPAARTYYSATQTTPSMVLADLRRDLAGPPEDFPVLVIAQGSGEDSPAHALMPYAVFDVGNGPFWVYVYDPNHPSDASRHVEIYPESETWLYDTGFGTWGGNQYTQSIGTVKVSIHDEAPTCDLSYDFGTSTLETEASAQVWLDGQGHLLISNAVGQSIGFVGEQYVNDLPGAFSLTPPADLVTGREPIYFVPLTDTHTILVDGLTLTETATVSVSRFGPGQAVLADNISLQPGTADLLTVSSDGGHFSYQASTAKEADLGLIVELDAESYDFRVGGTDMDANEEVSLFIAIADGLLALSNEDAGGGEYNVSLSRVDESGEAIFYHATVGIEAEDTHYFDYAAWDGSGAITVYVDEESNGSIDDTVELENELHQIYLPLVLRGS